MPVDCTHALASTATATITNTHPHTCHVEDLTSIAYHFTQTCHHLGSYLADLTSFFHGIGRHVAGVHCRLFFEASSNHGLQRSALALSQVDGHHQQPVLRLYAAFVTLTQASPKLGYSFTDTMATTYRRVPCGLSEDVGQFVVSSVRLSRGSFGYAALATHKATEEKAAVRVVQKRKLTADKDRLRVAHSVSALKALLHPNIVPLLWLVETARHVFIFSEYAPNNNLLWHLRTHGALGEQITGQYAQQLFSAVSFCHDRGVIHRNIKLEHVLLYNNNTVKLTGFGFCNQFSCESLVDTIHDSPHYVAPEIVAGKLPASNDERQLCDIWSLGVVLYACLFGRLPFIHEQLKPLCRLILQGRFALPSHVSGDAKEVLTRMLCTDLERRWSAPRLTRHPWVLAHRPSPLQSKDRDHVATCERRALQELPMSKRLLLRPATASLRGVASLAGSCAPFAQPEALELFMWRQKFLREGADDQAVPEGSPVDDSTPARRTTKSNVTTDAVRSPDSDSSTQTSDDGCRSDVTFSVITVPSSQAACGLSRVSIRRTSERSESDEDRADEDDGEDDAVVPCGDEQPTSCSPVPLKVRPFEQKRSSRWMPQKRRSNTALPRSLSTASMPSNSHPLVARTDELQEPPALALDVQMALPERSSPCTDEEDEDGPSRKRYKHDPNEAARRPPCPSPSSDDSPAGDDSRANSPNYEADVTKQLSSAADHESITTQQPGKALFCHQDSQRTANRGAVQNNPAV